MKINQAISKAQQLSDEELIVLDEMFKDYVLNRKTLKIIAEEHSLSIATISNRISLARAALLTHLQNNANLYIADVFTAYWRIYEQATKEFDVTRDVKFLTESRKALGDITMLLGLRAAPKAAVNDDPLNTKDANQDFVFVLDESQYRDAEQKRLERETTDKSPIIEGDIITDETDNS